jgi:nucleoside-diphosphate-sugar epimerase
VESQKGDVGHTLASIEKATRLLGYKPRVSIEEGLKRYVEWLLFHTSLHKT